MNDKLDAPRALWTRLVFMNNRAIQAEFRSYPQFEGFVEGRHHGRIHGQGLVNHAEAALSEDLSQPIDQRILSAWDNSANARQEFGQNLTAFASYCQALDRARRLEQRGQ